MPEALTNEDPPPQTTSRKRLPQKPTAPRRKPVHGAKHEDKLTAILRTAAQLFAQNGYESTSLDMIAERLGMHKATLYHYVSNKESILYQCLVKSFGNLDSVMKSMEDRSIPVLDRLRLFVRSLAVAQNNDFGRCLVLVGAGPLDNMTGDDIRQFQRRLDHTVRALITEGIAEGVVRPCHPGMVSALLFGALNWVPRWYSGKGSFTIQDVADNFVDTVVEGIGKDAS